MPEEIFEIAMTTFGYNNSYLINALTKRGVSIRRNDKKMFKECNKQIQEFMLDEEKMMQNIPCKAYVIF